MISCSVMQKKHKNCFCLEWFWFWAECSWSYHYLNLWRYGISTMDLSLVQRQRVNRQKEWLYSSTAQIKSLGCCLVLPEIETHACLTCFLINVVLTWHQLKMFIDMFWNAPKRPHFWLTRALYSTLFLTTIRTQFHIFITNESGISYIWMNAVFFWCAFFFSIQLKVKAKSQIMVPSIS